MSHKRKKKDREKKKDDHKENKTEILLKNCKFHRLFQFMTVNILFVL